MTGGLKPPVRNGAPATGLGDPPAAEQLREGAAAPPLIDLVLPLWDELDDFRGLVDGLRRRVPETLVHGLPAPGAALLVAAAVRLLGRPAAVVTPDWGEAVAARDALAAWLGAERVRLFPPREVLPYGVVAHSPELAAERLAVLEALVTANDPLVLVLPVAALRRLLPPPEVFADAILELSAGQELDISAVAACLVAAGYERTELVEGPGTFAVRGGLVDVFPLTYNEPVRIEWFGDAIESLRTFSAETQRSTEVRASVRIPPAREVPAPDDETRARVLATVQTEAAVEARRLGAEARGRVLELAEAEPNWEALAPLVYPLASVLDYLRLLPGEPLIFASEAARVAELAARTAKEEASRLAGFVAEGRLLERQAAALAFPQAPRADVYLTALPRSVAGAAPHDVLNVAGSVLPSFHGQWELALDELRRWQAGGYRLLFVVDGEERAAEVRERLDAASIPADVRLGALAAGVELPGIRLVVLTDVDLFGRPPKRRRVRRLAGGVRLQTYEDLQVGDYVVHTNNGVGQYLGTKTLEVQGVQRDYLLIRYEGADRLYVPTDQIDLIQKYIGGEGQKPRVQRLGSGEWLRTKQRVKESVKAMAVDLVQLYAARQALSGHGFATDTLWRREFQAAFPYEETPDQLQAIAEIEADMARPVPMDRLLCGDVGFGKTEVAMRAAFTAVMDGKQVAVLVPTTILAEQHFLTFTERFRGFPVKVGMLSRFRSRKEQEETITGLRTGDVDVVVGTHRLLQADVGFKDLGLLIVDEEHRFGVGDKERLKELRQTVDVLTLTATPIPRTLHMAMAGVRDMSVIETPPENRHPVETYVLEWSEALVVDAIARELARKGQVYYLHNRVRDVERVHAELRRLVPQADVVVAHGQMPEDELERVMVEFWRGEHDVLLCTTIIESGLDVPNANTLIVTDADTLGLAQLYQIRGRVGRSDRVAYAYFTFRRDKAVSEVAEKRLEAIESFTELGSGFKIALRDMEIRGAGNILGSEQHGFMAAVGFDLYAQLLEEAVRELRGDRSVPETRATVELRVDAYLPDTYIRDVRAKLEFYKKINATTSTDEVLAVEEELLDRFGAFPSGVANLLRLARFRLRAQALGLLAVAQDGVRITFSFPGYLGALIGEIAEGPRDHHSSGRARTPSTGGAGAVPRASGRGGGTRDGFAARLRVVRGTKPALVLTLSGRDDATVLRETEEVLAFLEEHPAMRRWREAALV